MYETERVTPTAAQSAVLEYLCEGSTLTPHEIEITHRRKTTYTLIHTLQDDGFPRLREIRRWIKTISNDAFTTNAAVIQKECLSQTILKLLERAEEFSDLPEEKREAFCKSITRTAAFKVLRKAREMQPPADPNSKEGFSEIGVLSAVDGESEGSQNGAESSDFVLIPSTRLGWKACNKSEDDLIAAIDASRTPKEPEPETEYEHAVRVLGRADADWYWGYKYDMETTHQRGTITRHLLKDTKPVSIEEARIPKTPAESHRFYRLKQRLGK